MNHAMKTGRLISAVNLKQNYVIFVQLAVTVASSSKKLSFIKYIDHNLR